jgi:hypothetical protein
VVVVMIMVMGVIVDVDVDVVVVVVVVRIMVMMKAVVVLVHVIYCLELLVIMIDNLGFLLKYEIVEVVVLMLLMMGQWVHLPT